jgi:ligand-binding sensor domain-containing protein
MTAAEGLPCATEVQALYVAADGALWVNTCARVFRFEGQRFHPIAGLSGMLSGARLSAGTEAYRHAYPRDRAQRPSALVRLRAAALRRGPRARHDVRARGRIA